MDLNTFLSNNFPVIAAIFGTIIIAVPVIWRVAKYYNSLESVKIKVKELPCTEHSKELSDVKIKVKELPCAEHSKEISDVKTDISFIRGAFETILGIKDNSVIKNSPLTLTEIGKSIAKEHNLIEKVNENWDLINNYLKESNIKHPYDLERFCLERTYTTPEKFFSANEIDNLKTIAYKSNNHFMTITRILTVLILERYFAENNIETNL